MSAHSDHRDVKKYSMYGPHVAGFLFFDCKTALVSLPRCGLLATLLHVLHDNVPRSVIFVTMHEKRGTAQRFWMQVLSGEMVGESGPDGVQ